MNRFSSITPLTFTTAASIGVFGKFFLVDLGVKRMRFLINNPKKIIGLEGYGLKVEERVPIEMPPGAENECYLRTKHDKLGHLLHLDAGKN